MEKEQQNPPLLVDGERVDETTDAVELVLFQVTECYVYLIPPRKSAASYRADEWNVNKWAWEGALKVISKGEECIIRLEDKATGELYARAFLRDGEPHPVEPVIDSSRYFVLRVEESIGGRIRHAFIGIGFRERTEAYDFQAALHDHMKYLNKKKTAEEMEQHFQQTSSVDYSLKEGQTLVLQIKTQKGSHNTKSAFVDQGLDNLSLDEKAGKERSLLSLKPPPPAPSPLSPVASQQQSSVASQKQSGCLQCHLSMTDGTDTLSLKEELQLGESSSGVDKNKDQEIVDDDFGDFQTAV